MFPEIWTAMVKFFVILDHLFPGKSKFWKNEKNTLRYHFRQVYQKS